MTGKCADWWTARRFGCISLALSLAEIAAIGTAIFVVQSSSHSDIPRIQSLAADAWLLGGIGSLGLQWPVSSQTRTDSLHFSPLFSLF